MDIAGKSVLILGGYGLVGQAVARRLVHERPREIVILSLRREAAGEPAVAALAGGFGEIRRGGRPFPLYDVDPGSVAPVAVGGRFRPRDAGCGRAKGKNLLGDAPRRREIVSIGIPILLPDGRLLRGP